VSFKKGYTPWNKGIKLPYETWNKGKKTPEETRRKQSVAAKGKNIWMKGRKLPLETRAKMGNARRGIHRPESAIRRGSNSNLWKGGVTPINILIRSSFEYKQWRKAVYERDNYTCQECHERGGKLHPHHIKSFSDYPELRFDVSNGVTLCESCHKKTPNYGRKVFLLRKFLENQQETPPEFEKVFNEHWREMLA
jgi:hypothetical protein